MTNPTMALAELAEKGADIDVLRQMVQFMAQRLMEIDVDGRCGAGYDEKSARAAEQPQRLPRAHLGHPRRQRRAEDPQAAPGQLLPRVPGAPAHGREGPDRRHPGGLRPGHLHPLGGRPGQGAGHERRVQEPGQPPVRRTRRARGRVPEPPDRGRLAVPVDRRHLRQDPRGRPHRERGGDSGGGREHRWPARGAGPEGRRLARPSRSGPSSCAA